MDGFTKKTDVLQKLYKSYLTVSTHLFPEENSVSKRCVIIINVSHHKPPDISVIYGTNKRADGSSDNSNRIINVCNNIIHLITGTDTLRQVTLWHVILRLLFAFVGDKHDTWRPLTFIVCIGGIASLL